MFVIGVVFLPPHFWLPLLFPYLFVCLLFAFTIIYQLLSITVLWYGLLYSGIGLVLRAMG